MANNRLYEHIEHTRPAGRPSVKPKIFNHDFLCKTVAWDRTRWVVAKIEWHQGELFPRVSFIVPNLCVKAESVARFYIEYWHREVYMGDIV